MIPSRDSSQSEVYDRLDSPSVHYLYPMLGSTNVDASVLLYDIYLGSALFTTLWRPFVSVQRVCLEPKAKNQKRPQRLRRLSAQWMHVSAYIK